MMTDRKSVAFFLRPKAIPFLMTATVVAIACLGVALPAQTPGSTEQVAKREAADLSLFEHKAALAKELGATDDVDTRNVAPNILPSMVNDYELQKAFC
jgi:hypothetical protein